MTELLYQTDASLREFSATVSEIVEGNGVILDRTAFYPGGGGQPADQGVLVAGDETWQVLKVKKVNGRPVHYLDRQPPPVGVSIVILPVPEMLSCQADRLSIGSERR